MNKKLLLGALVVCLLAFVAVFTFSQSSTNIRWEYTASLDGSGEEMNRLGREGLELVTILELKPGGINVTGYNLIYKRRLP
jgi:hypothetical protein